MCAGLHQEGAGQGNRAVGKHELVWGIPTLGILGQARQQVDLLKEDRGRVGGCAGFSGRGTSHVPPSLSSSGHTQSLVPG